MKNRIGKFELDFELPSDFDYKSIDKELSIDVYKLDYSYKTIRGNKKENHRYIMAHSYEEAECIFINRTNELNRKLPHKAVSNVKILGTAYLGKATL